MALNGVMAVTLRYFTEFGKPALQETICGAIYASVSSVASLGWVTPGAATEGVTPLFFPEKPGNLFLVASSAVSLLISSLQKLTTLFFSSLYRFLLLSLGCHPPRGCHPTPFLPVRPRFSTILCKFAHKKFFSFGCHPLEGVTRGGPPPFSDATVSIVFSSACTVIVKKVHVRYLISR